MHALRTGPDAVSIAAAVVGHGVDGAAGKVRPSHVPLAAVLVRAKDERAFHRPDEQKNVAVAGGDVLDDGHLITPVDQTFPEAGDCIAVEYSGGMDVVLFGATGMVGQGVLRECLLDPEVHR